MSARTLLRSEDGLQAYREGDEIVIEVRYPDITSFDIRAPWDGLEGLLEEMRRRWYPEEIR